MKKKKHKQTKTNQTNISNGVILNFSKFFRVLGKEFYRVSLRII